MRPLHLIILAHFCFLTWQTRVFAQTPAPEKPTASSPAAVALLDGAIKELTRPEGVDVRFHQEVFAPTQPVIVVGRSVTAPGKRVRIETEFKQVARSTKVKLLCDGTNFHRIESLFGQNSITTYTLKELQDEMEKLATTETEKVVKEDLEKEQQGMHGFEGVSALVKGLKTRMLYGEPKAATIDIAQKKAVAVQVIEGQWTKAVIDIIAPVKKGNDPNEQDQRYLWNEKMGFFYTPRAAKLYFDVGNKTLLRLELLGTKEKQGKDEVLTAIVFQSISPLAGLDEKLFKPSEEELKYKPITLDLPALVKQQHEQTLNILKFQHEMQSPGSAGKGPGR